MSFEMADMHTGTLFSIRLMHFEAIKVRLLRDMTGARGYKVKAGDEVELFASGTGAKLAVHPYTLTNTPEEGVDFEFVDGSPVTYCGGVQRSPYFAK
jgi:hypothetical protein